MRGLQYEIFALEKTVQLPVVYVWTGVMSRDIYDIFFSHEWAESANARTFVDAVAVVVPVLQGLKNHTPPYTPYWGVFYASFWCLVPLFFAAGAMSTFFLFTKESYEKIKLNKPLGYVFGFLFFLMVFMIPFFLPFIGNFPNPLMNQMSRFLPLRLLAWGTTAIIPFALGWSVGCTYQRFIVSRKY